MGCSELSHPNQHTQQSQHRPGGRTRTWEHETVLRRPRSQYEGLHGGPATITTPASQRRVFAWKISTHSGMPTAEAGRSSNNQVRQWAAAQGPSAGFQEHRFLCAGKAALLGRVNTLYSSWGALHSQPGRMCRLEVRGLGRSAPRAPSPHLAKGVVYWRRRGRGATQDNNPLPSLSRVGDKAAGKLSRRVRPA